LSQVKIAKIAKIAKTRSPRSQDHIKSDPADYALLVDGEFAVADPGRTVSSFAA
jgi:hypothetical protein